MCIRDSDRDLKLKKWFKLNQITWNEAIQNGVIRGLKSRDGWSKEWHKRMYSEIFFPPRKIINQDFTPEEIPLPEEIGLKNDGIQIYQKGGRKEGLLLLNSFLKYPMVSPALITMSFISLY